MLLLKRLQFVFFALIVAIVLSFLILPLFIVFFDMKPLELIEQLKSPMAVDALKLSISTTFISLAIILIFGTPLAYMLARFQFRGKGALEVLVQLPIVIPPAVAGVGLLMVFGRFGLFGQWFESIGISIGFSFAAVIMAQVFISASFYIQNARTAFAAVDPKLVSVSRTLGMNSLRTFIRISLPLAAPGLLSGAALSWARALGEFGATIMFAGNLPGKTQTMPLAIYTVMESDMRVAIAISALLIAVAFFLLLSVKLFEKWPEIRHGLNKRKEEKHVRFEH